MKMINRHILLYSSIVLISCLAYCLLFRYWNETGHQKRIPWVFLTYLLIVFGSALLISRKDEHHNYYGFSYHLATYIIANGVPLLLSLAGILPRETFSATLFVMSVWGIGLAFHLGMYLLVFRKRTIRHYDKEDVFK